MTANSCLAGRRGEDKTRAKIRRGAKARDSKLDGEGVMVERAEQTVGNLARGTMAEWGVGEGAKRGQQERIKGSWRGAGRGSFC